MNLELEKQKIEKLQSKLKKNKETIKEIEKHLRLEQEKEQEFIEYLKKVKFPDVTEDKQLLGRPKKYSKEPMKFTSVRIPMSWYKALLKEGSLTEGIGMALRAWPEVFQLEMDVYRLKLKVKERDELLKQATQMIDLLRPKEMPKHIVTMNGKAVCIRCGSLHDNKSSEVCADCYLEDQGN